MRQFLSFLILLSLCLSVHAQRPPAREFRGAWIATVKNVDWPSRSGLSTEEQQQELTEMLDQFQSCGINAVIFQVRPAGDAFYESSYEPWSEWLTGRQGQPPFPRYDPLEWLIGACHARGMELHAWFNPFRALTDPGSTRQLDPRHLAVRQPELLLRYGSNLYLDPGLPEAREYAAKIVSDVARRYDVDAIHFDDYFYPYRIPDQEFPDTASFRNFGWGGISRDDWRRQNTDAFVRMVRDSLLAIKPDLAFGISPFGVWRNRDRDPAGSDSRAGVTSYDDLYADVRKWLREGWIDYVAPQIYFSIGLPAADYAKVLEWWTRNSYGKHLYVGHSPYKIGDQQQKDRNWDKPDEITRQVQLLRSYPQARGSIYFSAKWFARNPLGFADTLREHLYRYPAFPPPMPWIDGKAPQPPAAITIRARTSGVHLNWIPGDQGANAYLIYRAEGKSAPDIRPENLIAVVRDSSFTYVDARTRWFAHYSYVVTAMDRQHNESAPADVVTRRSWQRKGR